jgi:hypothetical protein
VVIGRLAVGRGSGLYVSAGIVLHFTVKCKMDWMVKGRGGE